MKLENQLVRKARKKKASKQKLLENVLFKFSSSMQIGEDSIDPAAVM